MNTTEPTQGTLEFVARQIAQRPSISHASICDGDRDTRTRRAKALLILQDRGVVVRSKSRPWRYYLASQLQPQP